MADDKVKDQAANGSSEVQQNGNKPERVFRIGYCSASVFSRMIQRDDGQERIVRSVTLQKKYRKQDGSFDFTNSFGLAELPQILRAANLAAQHVESLEADA